VDAAVEDLAAELPAALAAAHAHAPA
jgi:hypothetical protein